MPPFVNPMLRLLPSHFSFKTEQPCLHTSHCITPPSGAGGVRPLKKNKMQGPKDKIPISEVSRFCKD